MIRKTVWLALLLAVLVGIAVGIALGSAWVMERASVQVPLHGQQMQARITDTLPVHVEVLDARGMSAKGDKRGIPVRLNETLRLDVDFDTEVPLALTVRYRGQIPVQAQVPVDTVMDTRVMGIAMSLPVKGNIPLDLSIPIDLTIPIEQAVRLKFTAPITARVDQTVHIPLKAELDARIRFGDVPIALRVEDSALDLPLRNLRVLGLLPGEPAPAP